MIDVKGLRIGNLVKTDNSTENYTDVEIVNLEILERIINGSEFYNPIIISNNYLLYFGFKNNNTYFVKYINEHECFILEKIKGYYYLMYNDFNTKIEFIHELQNLYYDLTKEELIK